MDATDGLEAFTSYHKQMFAVMAIVCIAVCAALFLAIPSDHAWAGGFAAGAAAQLFKFGFLDIAAIKKIAVERDAAATTQVKSMFLSLIVFGLAVVVVYKLRFNVWAMAAGIFLPRIILLLDAWLRPNPFGKIGAADAGAREDG